MSDTEQDPLTSRLAYLAGTMDDDDRPTLSDMLKTARAYLAPHIAGYTLAQPLLDDVVLGISLDLWQAKDARNGIVEREDIRGNNGRWRLRMHARRDREGGQRRQSQPHGESPGSR